MAKEKAGKFCSQHTEMFGLISEIHTDVKAMKKQTDVLFKKHNGQEARIRDLEQAKAQQNGQSMASKDGYARLLAVLGLAIAVVVGASNIILAFVRYGQ